MSNKISISSLPDFLIDHKDALVQSIMGRIKNRSIQNSALYGSSASKAVVDTQSAITQYVKNLGVSDSLLRQLSSLPFNVAHLRKQTPESTDCIVVYNNELGVFMFVKDELADGQQLFNSVSYVYFGSYPKNGLEDSEPDLDAIYRNVITLAGIKVNYSKDKISVYTTTASQANKSLIYDYDSLVTVYKKNENYKQELISSVLLLDKNINFRKQALREEMQHFGNIKAPSSPEIFGSPLIYSIHEQFHTDEKAVDTFKGVRFNLAEDSLLNVYVSVINAPLTNSGKALHYREKHDLFELTYSCDDLELLEFKYCGKLVYQPKVTQKRTDVSNMLKTEFVNGVLTSFSKNPDGFHLGVVKSDKEIASSICRFLAVESVKVFASNDPQKEILITSLVDYMDADKGRQLVVVNRNKTGVEAVLVLPSLNLKVKVLVTKKEYYSVRLTGLRPNNV